MISWDNRLIMASECFVGQFSVSIKLEKGMSSWWLMSVFGPNSYRKREVFRDGLAGLGSICEPNWCVWRRF